LRCKPAHSRGRQRDPIAETIAFFGKYESQHTAGVASVTPLPHLPALTGDLQSSPAHAGAQPDADGDALLTHLQQQLAACRTELQEFTYTVSHDLRAPLRHINAFAQIIEEDWPAMPPEMAGHLATIRQSAQLLTRQLDGLTTLSRLGLQPLQLRPVATATVVQEVVDDLVRQWPQRDMIWQLAPDLPAVWADAGMLRLVLALLLDNACKFTRHRSPAQISVGWTALASGQCCISVQDNGVGFNPAQAGQLFKVFARLHPQRDFEGLGLGLVQCRKLLQRMGGRISIAAAPNAGCEVTFTLPAAPAV